jgi:hypothetical protein
MTDRHLTIALLVVFAVLVVALVLTGAVAGR